MSYDPSAQQRYAPVQGYGQPGRDQPGTYEEKAGLTGAGGESYRESLLLLLSWVLVDYPRLPSFRYSIPKLWDSKHTQAPNPCTARSAWLAGPSAARLRRLGCPIARRRCGPVVLLAI